MPFVCADFVYFRFRPAAASNRAAAAKPDRRSGPGHQKAQSPRNGSAGESTMLRGSHGSGPGVASGQPHSDRGAGPRRSAAAAKGAAAGSCLALATAAGMMSESRPAWAPQLLRSDSWKGGASSAAEYASLSLMHGRPQTEAAAVAGAAMLQAAGEWLASYGSRV